MLTTPANDVAADESPGGCGSASSNGSPSEARLKPTAAKPLLTYSVIYADPPWRYDNGGTQGGVNEQYPTMDDESLCALEIPTSRNAVLYLWATAPRLPSALDVMLAWGFAYKTCAVWDKVRFGIGYWFRGQHELLLVGVRGNMRPPPVELRVASLIRCKSGLHSRKPDYVRDLIAKWFPNERKLEMFSRVARPGWDAYGNQVERDLLSGAVAPAPLRENDGDMRRREGEL